jgi:Tol biopolymer transport system component
MRRIETPTGFPGAISPDGRQIVHSEGMNIVIRDLESGSVVRTVTAGEAASYVAWSRTGRLAVWTGHSGSYVLMTFDAVGGPGRTVTTAPSAGPIAYSGDGRIAYVPVARPDGPTGVWVTDDTDGATPTQVASGRAFAAETTRAFDWSADGSQIAFQTDSDSNDYSIVVVPAKGGQTRVVATGGARQPRFLADGRLLYVQSTDIWITKSDGGAPTRLTNTPNGFETEPIAT